MIPLASLGTYELMAELARGGMAVLSLARRRGPGGFFRPHVVKRMLPELAKKQAFVDMFLDEARTLSRIHHPNVVQVQEFGEEGGEYYMVLEYLDGETLGGLARRLQGRGESLEFDLVAYALAEACAGVHAAHVLKDEAGSPLGVVHRDLSPQNIFLTYDGHVKVLDFGVALSKERIAKTEAGEVKGKFSYMSPEQCRGLALDARSDIFSLGIVLFELLTETQLFSRGSVLETMQAITEEPPLPPSRVNPQCPRELDDICMRALAKEPSERHESALRFRRELLSLIAPGDDPSERLRTRLHSLFADRISEKQALLARVRAGETVVKVPEVDVDTHVTLPPMTQGVHAVSPGASPSARQGARRALLWGGTILGGLATSVLGFQLARSKGGASDAPPVATTLPSFRDHSSPSPTPSHGASSNETTRLPHHDSASPSPAPSPVSKAAKGPALSPSPAPKATPAAPFYKFE